MTPRLMLTALIYAFLTLLVAFAVVMGGYLLAIAVQDSQLATVLRIIGVTCLLLLAIDGVLLLFVLALRALAAEARRERLRSRTSQPAGAAQLPENNTGAGD